MAKVISVHARHVASAETAHAISGEATHVTPAEAADAASAEAADVASAEAAHMASATTTSMSSATAAATAGLCISGKKAAGKHRACQDHYNASSHDILLWDGRNLPPQGLVRRRRVRGRQMPTSRWTEDEDTDLSFPLNSRSLIRSERAARARTKVCAGSTAETQMLQLLCCKVRIWFAPLNCVSES
jgi:hypothetical protein